MTDNLATVEHYDQTIDALECEMLKEGVLADLPVTHRFTPGLYIREIFMKQGTLLTSKIHNTQHPFCILSGKCRVLTKDGTVETLEAGHFGITEAGTRRALFIEEDCRWVTYHALSPHEEAQRAMATEEELLKMIENRIIERRVLSDGKTAGELFKEELESRRLT